MDEKKIKCEHCGTEISKDILMEKQGHCNTCLVCGEFYNDTIQCAKCNTSFSMRTLYDKNGCTACLVCGEKFDLGLQPKDDGLVTWYWYDSGTMTKTLYSHRTPIYTFKAKDDSADAIEKLREYEPNAFAPIKETPTQTKCPNCGSTNIQLVPRKWSLMAGIFTNKVDRMCVNCGRKF